MRVQPDGKFVVPLDRLSKGLRRNQNNRKNQEALVSCSGVFGRDGLLEALNTLTRIDTSGITTSFPYPQIFVAGNLIIVCSQTEIYEYVSGSLALKLTTVAGSTWSLVSFGDFIYLSNGKVAVTKDADTKVYALSSFPTAMAICNFNGQVIIGAPDAGSA